MGNVWRVRALRTCSSVQSWRSWDFPPDLSICFADLRSFRKPNLGGLMKAEDLNRLLAWAKGLTTPGVLVIPQPLLVTKNPHESNLLDYTQDYCRLLAALGSTGHDIVVMSGDVHYGRVVSVKLGHPRRHVV